MTAIAGIIAQDPARLAPEALGGWRIALSRYGRDAWDEWRHPGGVLARALLRTLPEDVHDRQPLWHEPSGTALVFDGRIDNRDEIARALGVPARDLASMADSDLALRAVLVWDIAAAERLRGAFAFASWQPARRRLWLARDPMGHRPLFWHQSRDLIAFASMPAGLLALSGVSRALDEREVANLLMLKIGAGPQSIYSAVRCVEAGRVVELVDGALRIRRFHALDAQRELRLARDEDYVEAFRDVLDRAVGRCLRSSGPVASQLSSGYDSSTVTAVAARLLAARGERMLAYTAVPRDGFAGPVPKGREGDESIAAAALVARLPNVDHIRISGAGRSILACAREGARLMGRPLRNPTNTPWMCAISEDAAGRGAKVVLTGQCGNATISLTGGSLLPVLCAQGRLGEWWREAAATRRRSGRSVLRGWLGIVRGSLQPLMPEWVARRRQRRHLGTDKAPPPWSPISASLYARWRREGEPEGMRLHGRSRNAQQVRMRVIEMLEGVEMGEYSALSNAAGVDLRDPTKDQELAEFCVSVPLEQLCRGGQTRWLLRRAMAGVLPPEIMDCTGKGYQAADWFEQVGAELPQLHAELRAMAECPTMGHFIDVDGLEKSLRNWPGGGWETAPVNQEFHYRMLRGIAVGMFVRDVCDGSPRTD